MGTTLWRRRLPFAKSLRNPRLSPLAANEAGVALIEYAFLASLIAIAIVGAVAGLGGKVGEHWNGIDQSMPR